MKQFVCTLGGACFGHERASECSILTEPPSTYAKGFCPFQKPERDVTDGVRYPYMYAKDCREKDGEIPEE